MVAVAFRDWLLAEERQSVDPYTLQSFERIFDDELDRLIQRCQDNPQLQRTLQSMRDCPVRTAKGCTRWTDYALGALIRHCGNTVHLEDAFAYVMFRLLSRVGERGQPKPCLFDMDPDREYDLAIGNPLLARFRRFLINDVRSIAAGKIRRLMLRPNREPTVPIRPGRTNGDDEGGIRAEEIPAPNTDQKWLELQNDIVFLLQRRSTPEMPLVDLFHAVVNGMATRESRKRFGHTVSDRGRKIIYDTLLSYAQSTGNRHLENLLIRFKDFKANQADPNSPRRQKKTQLPRPAVILSPQERDFRSLVQVIHRNGGRASLAQFGSQRSRWLGRPPRDPSSSHKTRLHDVLDQMVQAGVLEKRGATYIPGANYGKYVDAAAIIRLIFSPIREGRQCFRIFPSLIREIRNAATFKQNQCPGRRPYLRQIYSDTKRRELLDGFGMEPESAQGPSVLPFGPDSEGPPQIDCAGAATAKVMTSNKL